MDLPGNHTEPDRVPYYKKRGHTASTFLLQSRRELLTRLPVQHAMRERTGPSGMLRQRRLPAIPRPAFTDEEIREIKKHRNEVAADPDHAHSHLQRSQLVNMWNADCDHEGQWKEYDQAQPIMEERREYSGLPDEVFDSHDIVGEKRKRIVSSNHEQPPATPKMRFLDEDDDMITEAGDFEEGEIDENVMQSIEDINQQLREQNEALRLLIENGMSSSPPEAPPSPPESDTSEQSTDDGEAVGHHVDTSLDTRASSPNTSPDETSSMEYLEPSRNGSSSSEGEQQH
ncbi:hypothetical protein PMZ80_002735 [Knufia obscura]|uniref:Uncharacterized protein n=1 Tax=Knufia obscura TaxID=1635080 RepID=A0ABR0RZ46_9EURO|nr:hypothetical protein PMZ80_002735 [Knufia obscura]